MAGRKTRKKTPAPLDLSAAVESFFQERRKDFGHDRTKTVGASEIGRCARMTAYKKRNTPEDEGYKSSGGFAERGNVMEDAFIAPFVKRAVEQVGGQLWFAGQNDQLSIVFEEEALSATPDGLVTGVHPSALAAYGVDDCGGKFLVEFKSIDPRVNEGKLPKQEHVDQANYALGVVRMAWQDIRAEYGIAGEHPLHCLLIYIDASDYSKITAFTITFSEEMFNGQKPRAKMLVTADPEKVMPEGKVTGGRECKLCAFANRCAGFVGMVPADTKTPDTKQMAKIKTLARQILHRKEQAEALTLEYKALEGDLKMELNASGTKFVKGKDFEVEWKTRAGSSLWDMPRIEAQLRASGFDPAKFRKEGRPSESMSVKALASVGG